jgi:hypothetical protein
LVAEQTHIGSGATSTDRGSPQPSFNSGIAERRKA